MCLGKGTLMDITSQKLPRKVSEIVIYNSIKYEDSVQNLLFLVVQPRGKAAILGVNTTEFFLDEGFT